MCVWVLDWVANSEYIESKADQITHSCEGITKYQNVLCLFDLRNNMEVNVWGFSNPALSRLYYWSGNSCWIKGVVPTYAHIQIDKGDFSKSVYKSVILKSHRNAVAKRRDACLFVDACVGIKIIAFSASKIWKNPSKGYFILCKQTRQIEKRPNRGCGDGGGDPEI